MTLTVRVLFPDGVRLESPESSLSSGVKTLDYTAMIGEGEPASSAVAKQEGEGVKELYSAVRTDYILDSDTVVFLMGKQSLLPSMTSSHRCGGVGCSPCRLITIHGKH